MATTYQVGPSRPTKKLSHVASTLRPGDIVELEGNQTYEPLLLTASGTKEKPIVLRGIRVNGNRPLFSGGTNTLHVQGNYVTIEGVELVGGSYRCFFHQGHEVVLRDSVVHGCPKHGILSADDDSGSLTLDQVEVFDCGSGDKHHCIYVATDEVRHPGSVFRMQRSYVHDTKGGNGVKSRAERNEIYYNWLEGARYHELELIGPDGSDPDLVREDSDVVGNVFRKLNDAYTVRIGGDGTADTNGRYRFVNNTFLLPASNGRAIFRVFDRASSLELDNNVFYKLGGGPITLIRDAEARWAEGTPRIIGRRNWIPRGSNTVPRSLVNTLTGDDPGLVDVDSLELRPAKGSPLVNAAAQLARPSFDIARPLLSIEAEPSRNPATHLLRTVRDLPDVGAFEGGIKPQRQPAPTIRHEGEGSGRLIRGATGCGGSRGLAQDSNLLTAVLLAGVLWKRGPVRKCRAPSS